jgi:hypothetical protein
MKRTVLLTILALSLTLGASSVHAGSCSSCGVKYSTAHSRPVPTRAFSFWQQAMLLLSSVFGGVYIPS